MISARTRVNVALALLVAGLAAWLLLKPSAETPAARPVLDLDPASVSRIRVERAGLPALALERARGSWRITSPVAARADAHKVERLLETARARGLASFPAEDLGRFELQPPAATLTLDDRAVGFGMLNPVTSAQYVLAGGAVHAISPKYYAALPLTADDVISRTLLAPGETLTGIDLPGIAARRGENGWTLDTPAPDLSRDDVNIWVDRWRHAVAAEAGALGTAPDPHANAALMLEDGRRVELAVERAPANVFVTRLDERVRYRFPPAVGAALLTAPGASK